MYELEVNKLKKKILKVANSAGEGHLGSSFSVLDILFVLYERVANISPENIDSPFRDFVILSKGHASLGHAAILANKGFFDEADLESYCSYDSILGGHLSRCSVPGVEVSTGSLGHGISVGAGIALSSKIKNIDNHVYIIVGDGEINEGTFWEALLLIAHHNLKNIRIIIDFNRSNDRALKLDPLEDKIKSFGFEVLVLDGHHHLELTEALDNKNKVKPSVIIAQTIKGKGIKEMENNPEWHHKTPSEEDIERMLEELS